MLSLTPMQTAAAIFQVLPGSPIFRLPALAHPDVHMWMKTVFPSELACLQANAGSPVDLMRIQNEAMRQALEENRVQLHELRLELSAMRVSFERRTAVLSPAKAYSHRTYISSGMCPSCLPFSYFGYCFATSISCFWYGQLGPIRDAII